MDHPKFIVANQKEESISIQRVNNGSIILPTSQVHLWQLSVGCGNISLSSYILSRRTQPVPRQVAQHSPGCLTGSRHFGLGHCTG